MTTHAQSGMNDLAPNNYDDLVHQRTTFLQRAAEVTQRLIADGTGDPGWGLGDGPDECNSRHKESMITGTLFC